MSWVLAFLGFAALIIFHELGHFTAAKAVGMRVERFALFFPPLIYKVKRGETEYGIGAIPLGGYVRITGMNPNEEIDPEVLPRAYYMQPVWKRIFVIAAGPAVNLLIAFLLLFFIYSGNGINSASTKIGAVEKNSPAAAVLVPGEKLVAIDGKTGDTQSLTKLVGAHPCAGKPTPRCAGATPVRLTVLVPATEAAPAHTVTRVATPFYDPVAKRMRLGFSFGNDHHDLSIAGAGNEAVSEMWRVASGSVTRIGKLFYSSEARKQVTGTVGLYEETRQSIEFDGTQALFILAIISLSLAVINLFPFLPLDGGHIFWAMAEKVRGRAIPFRVMERASVVGFLLVMFLFVVGLSNDIGRLSGQGFKVR